MIFGDLPAGNYTLTPTSASGSWTATATRPSRSRRASSARARTPSCSSTTRPDRSRSPSRPESAGSLVPSNADSIMVFNTGMTTPKTFGTIGYAGGDGHRHAAVPVHLAGHGLCRHLQGRQPESRRRPEPPAPRRWRASSCRAGGSAPATIQLPALFLTVLQRNELVEPGLPGLRAGHGDGPNCPVSGTPVKRTLHHQLRRTAPRPRDALRHLRRLRRQREEARAGQRRQRQGPGRRHDARPSTSAEARTGTCPGAPARHARARRGFTLVELLVAIASG